MSLLECKKAYSVYETDNYELFNFIKENRSPKKTHVKSLKQQLEEGFEFPPIIVNEEGEIIDGQHRFLAAKELEKQIQFIIKKDNKEDTLQKSNTLVSKWTTRDHINYHATKGNENYVQLREFMEYSLLTAPEAAKLLGKAKTSNEKRINSISSAIQNGMFVVTNKSDAYQFVDEIIMRIRMEKKNGKIINSLRSIYNLGVDNKLLVNVVNALEEEIILLNREAKIIERIVKLYNKQCDKSERIKLTYNTQGRALLDI